MKLGFKFQKETSTLQRKRDKEWLNGRFREWENRRCDENNKTNKILHTRAGKGRRKSTNSIRDIKGNRLNKLLTKLELWKKYSNDFPKLVKKYFFN